VHEEELQAEQPAGQFTAHFPFTKLNLDEHCVQPDEEEQAVQLGSN